MPKRPTVEVKCAATGEIFLKDKREYDRQVREGATRFFKNRQVAGPFLAAEKELPSVIKACQHCGKTFQSSSKARARSCCSRKCAALCSLSKMSEEQKQNQREAASRSGKKLWQEIREGKRAAPPRSDGRRLCTIEERTRHCVVCDAAFLAKDRSTRVKTCSKSCSSKLMSRLARENPNCGGETNYKRYVYNDITMDSAWEVEIAQWMDAHQVKWTRSRKMMFHWTDETGAKRRYYPDFYLPDYNVYLDPKNKYLIEKDRYKMLAAQRENGITIIWGLKETLFAYLEALIRPV